MLVCLQFSIAKDVREQTQYEKKFPLAGVNPAVGHFGGRSVDMWVAVTSSGAVCINLFVCLLLWPPNAFSLLHCEVSDLR